MVLISIGCFRTASGLPGENKALRAFSGEATILEFKLAACPPNSKLQPLRPTPALCRQTPMATKYQEAHRLISDSLSPSANP